MITEKQIEIAQQLLSTGIVNKVYHSVELVQNVQGERFPAYKVGAEEFYVGPDDSRQRFAYIRQTGTATVQEENRETSERKRYRLNVPLRIVVFKDREDGSFDELTRKLLKVTFGEEIRLLTFNHNAFQNAQRECPVGNFAFDATTFYLTIDISARIWIGFSTCATDDCIVHPNPICES